MKKIKEALNGKNGIPRQIAILKEITQQEFQSFCKYNNCTMIEFGFCYYFIDNKNNLISYEKLKF